MDNAVASGVTAQMAKHNRALKERIKELEQELQAHREAANIVLSDVMCSSDRDRDSYAEIRWSTVDKLQAALMGYYRPH